MQIGKARALASAPDAMGRYRLVAAPAPAQTGSLPAPVSDAGGEWTVDWARARHDAKMALNSIDWSKRDIVIWVPGTDNHKLDESFEMAVRDSWQDGGVSLSRVEYPATWDVRSSAPTGVATMRLILAGIAAHGGNHRVLMAGESQGAWILGEALADPTLRAVVDRAIIFGHPSVAHSHFEDGHDPNVRELNHEGDLIAVPSKGNLEQNVDAMVALHKADLSKLGVILGALSQNPLHGLLVLRGALGATVLKGVLKDPHDYKGEFTAAVEWLRAAPVGTRDAAAGAALATPRSRRRRAQAA